MPERFMMASNKRPARDLSPRDTQEPKKVKKPNSNASAEQNFYRSARFASDTIKSTQTPTRTQNAGNTGVSHSRLRSTGITSGNRPESPVRGENAKRTSTPVPRHTSRSPLKISTASEPSHGDHPGSPTTTNSAKGFHGPTIKSNPRPPLKKANSTASVSLPPPHGPAPTAPMMGSSATPSSATMSSVTGSSTSACAGSPYVETTTGPDMSGFHVLVRLLAQYTSQCSKKDRPGHCHQDMDGQRNQTQALQNFQVFEEETTSLENRLVTLLEGLVGGNINAYDKDADLVHKVQALEERSNLRQNKLKATLSRSQVSESPPGVISHDELRATIDDAIKKQLSAKLAGPLSATISQERTPKKTAAENSTSKESSSLTSEPSKQGHWRTEVARLQKDLASLRKTVTDGATAEKEMDAKVSTLEKENFALRKELEKLQETVKASSPPKTPEIVNLKKELSSLHTALNRIQHDKPDQRSFSAFEEKIEAKMKILAEKLSSVKNISVSADPRKKIFLSPSPETDDQISKMQKRMDAVIMRIEDLPDSEKFLQFQADLDRHDELLTRCELDLRSDNDRINSARKDIDNLDEYLSDLQHKTEALEDEVKALIEQMKSLTGEMNSLKTSSGTINGTLSELMKLPITMSRHEEEIRLLTTKVAEKSDSSRAIKENLDSLITKQDAYQRSFKAILPRVKNAEESSARIQALEWTVHGLEDKLAVQPFAKDEVEQRFRAVEEMQSSLQTSVQQVKTDFDFRSTLATLKADTEEHGRSIKDHGMILHGFATAAATREKDLAAKPGIIEQLDELRSSMTSLRRTIRKQSKGSDASSPQPSSSRLTPILDVAAMESRIAMVEQDLVDVKKKTQALQIDFEGWEEAQAQQSELIEADVKTRIKAEVAHVVPSGPHTPTMEAIQQMLNLFASNIRQEIAEVSQAMTRRPASPNIEEIEDVVFPKLKQSTSVMINESLTEFNNRLSELSELLDLFQAKYPSTYAEVLADMVLFSQTQGLPSKFLTATSNAVRNVQTQFDNIKTTDMAVYMLNNLIPHINNQLAHTVTNMIIAPVQDRLAPLVFNQLKTFVDTEVKHMKQQIETELVNKSQQMINVKIRDLEQIKGNQANTSETVSKTFKDEADARIKRLEDDIQRTLQRSEKSVDDLRAELTMQWQELSQSYNTLKERIENHAQEHARVSQKVREELEEQKNCNSGFSNENKLLWESYKENRDNIESALTGVCETQFCVAKIAQRVDPNLVPRSWLDNS